ncbi:MAG TPA: hypothetical protein VFM24_02880 [Nitrospira sp.]|nr:hypothetical protein [Nitrospira sp.]
MSGLEERIARAIDDLDKASPTGSASPLIVARACLAEIEAAGYVVVPRGSVAMLLEVHLNNPAADDWSINVGARPHMWHDTGAYLQAWDSLRAALLAASPKPV